MRLMVGLGLAACVLSGRVLAQVQLVDEFDRAAFRAWFVWLADAQFDRPSPDVTDCAALVRHAFREALKSHDPEWIRRNSVLAAPTYAHVRRHRPSGARPGPSSGLSAAASRSSRTHRRSFAITRG